MLYVTEAMRPDKTSTKRVDKLIDTAVHKIFKTFDDHVTCDIRKFVGLSNLKELIDERQRKFMKKKISRTVGLP